MPVLLGGEEGLEDALAGLGVHAAARCRVTASSDVGARRRARRRGARTASSSSTLRGLDGQSWPPLGHRVARVDDQVHDHLLDLARGPPRTVAERRPRARDELDVLADQAPQHLSRRSATTSFRSSTRGCEHLLAAEGQELAGERGRALARPARSRRSVVALRIASGGPSRERARRSRGSPSSRLLKSCATPPASRPIASIFCDWRSCSSSCWTFGDVGENSVEVADAVTFVSPGHAISQPHPMARLVRTPVLRRRSGRLLERPNAVAHGAPVIWVHALHAR